MNTKIKRLFIAVVLVGLAFASVAYIRYCTIGSEVHIQCTNMMYACGDCYPAYRIEDVYANSNKFNLLNEEIDIKFEDPAEKEKYYDEISLCAICFDYYFKGHIQYSVRKQCYTIKVKEYSLVERKDCCTDSLRQ